jgi:ATP-dependent Zn protease
MKAYHCAYELVAKQGMDSNIGYISFPDAQYTKPYGEEIESAIDREIYKIIKECTKRT